MASSGGNRNQNCSNSSDKANISKDGMEIVQKDFKKTLNTKKDLRSDQVTKTMDKKKATTNSQIKPVPQKKKAVAATKVVQSRFRQAAANATASSNSSGNKSGDSFKNRSNNSRESIVGSKSTLNLSQMRKNLGRSSTNFGPQKKTKLHSTILDMSMMSERSEFRSTNNLFSTTLVGGIGPSVTRKFNPQNANGLEYTMVSLPEIPDISSIKLDGSNTTTYQSESSNNDSRHEFIEDEITKEDLELEYYRYLTANCLDVSTSDVYESQVKEAKREITFLKSLSTEKNTELNELKQKIELLEQYEAVNEAYEEILALHQELDLHMPKCEDAHDSLYSVLEKRLHQIQIENITMPENTEKYRADLLSAIKSLEQDAAELNVLLCPEKNTYNVSSELITDLVDAQEQIENKRNMVHQAAGFAVQEASLLITENQT